MRRSCWFALWVVLLVPWGAVAAQPLPEHPFNFRWKAVEGAGGYRAEVRSPEGSAVLTQVFSAETSSTSLNLDPGPYELRLTTLNRLGLDESSTIWMPIHVAAAAPPRFASGVAPVIYDQASILKVALDDWAVDGTLEVRSPKGMVLRLSPQRDESNLVVVNLPSLTEKGAWDLMATNPPNKTAHATIEVVYPAPSVQSLDPTEFTVSDSPQSLGISGGWFSPEVTVAIRTAAGEVRPLAINELRADHLACEIPADLPYGDYQLEVCNAPDAAPVQAGSLRFNLPYFGLYPRWAYVELKTPLPVVGGIVAKDQETYIVSDPESHLIRQVGPSENRVLAGTGKPGASNGGLFAPPVSFREPRGLALDGAGNLFIADTGNNLIRKINSKGQVSTVAGSGKPGSADGRAEVATFRNPRGVVSDRLGNLWVADTGNGVIRKIDTSGNVTTVSQLWKLSVSPEFLALDGGGKVYVSDPGTKRLWVLDTDGSAFEIPRDTTEGGEILDPQGICIDWLGNIVVADGQGHRLWHRLDSGLWEPWVGSGDPGHHEGVGPQAVVNQPQLLTAIEETVFVVDASDNSLGEVRRLGPVLQRETVSVSTVAEGRILTLPKAIAVDYVGNRYYLDGDQIWRVDLATYLFVGPWAGLNHPQEMILAPDDTLIVSDTGNNRVVRVDAQGQLRVLVSGLNRPEGLALDGDGTLYIADRGSGRVVKVTAKGVQSVVASGLREPRGVAVVQGLLYVAEAVGILVLDSSGHRAPLAGLDVSAPRSDASDRFSNRFSNLGRMIADPQGNLWVTDQGANRLWKVTPSGATTLVAGAVYGEPGFDDFDDPRFNGPLGLTFDPWGRLFVADVMNQAVRCVVRDAGSDQPEVGFDKVTKPLSRDIASRTITVDGSPDDWAGVAPLFTPAVADHWSSGPGTWPNALYLARDDRYFYWMMTFLDGSPTTADGSLTCTVAFTAGYGTELGLYMNTRPWPNDSADRVNIAIAEYASGLNWRNGLEGFSGGSVTVGEGLIECRYPLAALDQYLNSGETYEVISYLSGQGFWRTDLGVVDLAW